MNKRVMFIDVALEYKEDDEYREIIKALDESSRENIDKPSDFLKKASDTMTLWKIFILPIWI